MISYLEGRVLLIDADCITIKTNGVGYNIWLSKNELQNINLGQDIELYIYTHVREDALDLYGFASLPKKQLFMLLIGVSGIGPKLGLSIISSISVEDLIVAIATKNISMLVKIPGIGRKMAERLCLELDDKIKKTGLTFTDSSKKDLDLKTNLEQAIRGLGYSKAQTERAMMGLSHDEWQGVPLEELIKRTLNTLRGNKQS